MSNFTSVAYDLQPTSPPPHTGAAIIDFGSTERRFAATSCAAALEGAQMSNYGAD